MIKKEVLEIRKLFTPSKCNLTRICGCYVDAEKNKRTHLKKPFFRFPKKRLSNILIFSGKPSPAPSEKIC